MSATDSDRAEHPASLQPTPRLARPWRRVALWLFLIVLVLFGLAHLRFDVEVLNLLPRTSRAVHGLKLYQQNFSNAGELIITVRAPAPEGAEYAARVIAEELQSRGDLVAAVTWQPPWLEYPGQVAELAAYLWLNQPPEIFGVLTNRLLGTNVVETLLSARDQLATSLSPEDVARLSRDPFDLLKPPTTSAVPAVFDGGQNLFASLDGTFRIVFVRAADELRNYRACRDWLGAVRQVVEAAREEHHISPEIIFRFTGRPAFVAEIAGGMERDINSSVGGTLLIIAVLFYWAHRTWRPLLWLIGLLTFLLAATLSLGGLLLGELNVVSAGFAAILLGLAADYGLVLYQEHRTLPGISVRQIRRQVGPGIVWSAVTTAGAFLTLNLGGLPGLAQLGSLVGIGIVLAAFVMLYAFLPLASRSSVGSGSKIIGEAPPVLLGARDVLTPVTAWTITIAIAIGSLMMLCWRPPVIDHSPDPLRPRYSPAYSTLEEIRVEMKREQEPLWLIVTGADEKVVSARLKRIVPVLERAQASGAIRHFTLPAELWPHPDFQQINRRTLSQLLPARAGLREAAQTTGFTSDAMFVTEAILDTWARAGASDHVFWPTNHLSRWVLGNFTAHSNDGFLALGLIHPQSDSDSGQPASYSPPPISYAWASELPTDGVWLAGWGLLGRAVLDVVERDLGRVLIAIIILLLVALGLAFCRPREIWLSFATLALGALGLLGVMSLAGWSWNLLNLMALPLLLGTGVDYSIHMQLALRRHGGEIARVRQIVGRALMLCALTTVAGFGSLAWSSNAGLASLGAVCATGVALNFLIAVYLLPAWWRSCAARSSQVGVEPSTAARPSTLYRTEVWRLGLTVARRLPLGVAAAASRVLGAGYWRFNEYRRDVVINNLLPVVNGDQEQAAVLSRELLASFARKIFDLWRYESGVPAEQLVAEVKGWEHFQVTRKHGRGVLLLTAHIGNWELGAPLLAGRGIDISVITLHEPHAGLTELRQASRSQWGVDTLVIGENPFAFVDVIRRLDNGGTVALLVDRPPVSSAAIVDLFGRPFAASIAAAELARASGCVLLPVCLPWVGPGYRAEMMPEILYERAALGTRAGREKLTQEIMRRFEPVIREHASQWYHFVPVWPR